MERVEELRKQEITIVTEFHFVKIKVKSVPQARYVRDENVSIELIICLAIPTVK